MALLKRKQVEELANFHGAHCASIFIPTARAGEEVIGGKFRILFEQELRGVQQDLEKYGLQRRESDAFLAPARKLAEDSGFWRRQSDGLAVFIARDFFTYYTVPVPFQSFHYVADHFYIKPLMPLFSGDGRFFILGLTLHGAQFFEATRHTITEVYVEDLTPARLEEVVGYDYEEKILQFRSQRGGVNVGTVFHGQGEQNEKRKEEVLQYCRAVDRGLMQLLHDEKAPMVVAAVDFVFSLFKEANKYKNLVDKNISGNPEHMELALLHEMGWEKVHPVFEAVREDKKQQYDERKHTDRTSYRLEEIVPAAVNGRVDTLFVQNRSDVFGRFDPASGKVEIEEEKEIANTSLLNLAAAKTFLQGGQVFLIEAGEMPEADTTANALYRF